VSRYSPWSGSRSGAGGLQNAPSSESNLI
jgi:hypothetical protein